MSARPQDHSPVVEIVVGSPHWTASLEEVGPLLQAALAAAAGAVRAATGELAVLLTEDAEIRALNRQFRDRDTATNVLAFPPPAALAGSHQGDIAIAFETAAAEADAQGKQLAQHVAHLGVHGFLHLLGYDHQDEDEAEAMERLEAHILADVDIPDPYGETRGVRRG